MPINGIRFDNDGNMAAITIATGDPIYPSIIDVLDSDLLQSVELKPGLAVWFDATGQELHAPNEALAKIALLYGHDIRAYGTCVFLGTEDRPGDSAYAVDLDEADRQDLVLAHICGTRPRILVNH